MQSFQLVSLVVVVAVMVAAMIVVAADVAEEFHQCLHWTRQSLRRCMPTELQ